ncbi:hypothetical protein RYX36_003216 [Vicia faba]
MRIVKDYNQYVLRNLDRGYSRKDLGVSYVKEKRLRVNRRLKTLQEKVKEQQEKVGVKGHLFLILVYQYLLFHGESYLAAGGEQVFKILGPGVFGASAFDILGALPESLILLGNVFNSQYKSLLLHPSYLSSY